LPNPTATDVHQNAVLTNLSIAFMQDASEYIADRVFPRVPVQKQSDIYYTYDMDYWFRAEAQKRAPATESAGGGYKLNTDSYRCDVYAFHKDVADQERANADSVIQLDREGTEFVMGNLLLTREIDWATDNMTTGVWTGATGSTDITGVSSAPSTDEVVQWNDVDSTPIEDVSEQATSIMEKTGKWPNTLVLGPKVFDRLKHHPDILDRIKYTQRGVVTTEILAGLFEVDRIFVPRCIKVTTPEGRTSHTKSFIYGKSALLCYAAPAPGLRTPSAGYTFTWSGYTGLNNMGVKMKKFRMEELEADRIEGGMAYDMKVVAADLGAYFTSIVA